jgi:hypothetical protein
MCRVGPVGALWFLLMIAKWNHLYTQYGGLRGGIGKGHNKGRLCKIGASIGTSTYKIL